MPELEPLYKNILFEDEDLRVAASDRNNTVQVTAIGAIEKPRLIVSTMKHNGWTNRKFRKLEKDYRSAWCAVVSVQEALIVEEKDSIWLFERDEKGELKNIKLPDRDIAFIVAMSNYSIWCTQISDKVVTDYLSSISAENREILKKRDPEDTRFHAAHWLSGQYCREEMGKLGHQECESSLIGRYNWVMLDCVTGDDEGSRIASKYYFDSEEVVRRGGDVKQQVIDWRREGDLVIFIGANEKWPQNDYWVGLAWAPEDLVKIYLPDEPMAERFLLI